MTQEEKQLLLKDLCARLPYGVLFQDMRWPKTPPSTMGIFDYWRMECKIYGDEPYRPIEEFKMYLRPMSSMTEKEKKVYDKLRMNYYKLFSTESSSNLIDWLNEHHFDYRVDPETGKSMIDMELAIEAPGDMYKTE